MPLTEEQLKKLPLKAQAFWRKAFAFVREHQTDWVLIAANSPEHEAWAKYFRDRNWEPFAMKQLRLRLCERITMPAQWPEWFERGYVAAIEQAAE